METAQKRTFDKILSMWLIHKITLGMREYHCAWENIRDGSEIRYIRTLYTVELSRSWRRCWTWSVNLREDHFWGEGGDYEGPNNICGWVARWKILNKEMETNDLTESMEFTKSKKQPLFTKKMKMINKIVSYTKKESYAKKELLLLKIYNHFLLLVRVSK